MIGGPDNRFSAIYSFSLNSSSVISPSDIRIKENIKPCPPLYPK
jgi:hypothetical protein